MLGRMKFSIRERRLALNITQKQLAEACKCTHQRISAIENKSVYPTPEQKQKIAEMLNCSPDDLSWRPQPTHKPQPEKARELLTRFRHKSSYRPPRERTGDSRLATLRNHYSTNMRRLEPLLEIPENRQFVDDAPFDSALETLKCLDCIMDEDALPTEAAPSYVGFDLHPVVDPKTRRSVGHCPVPALVTERYLAILQVSVLTPHLYTMDALLCVIHEGKRYFFALEIDGPGKPPPDIRREQALGMPIIRFTKDEVLRGVTIGSKLDEFFGC